MLKKLVVITGASSGIGKAIAKKMSKKGHPLLLLSRRLELMEEMNLPNCICKKVDVTDQKSIKDALVEAEKVYGPTDCLINNAGVMLLGETDNQNPEEWNTMFDVNVKGLLNGIQSVLAEMKKRQDGTIINISSLAGRKIFDNHAIYCGSKFAVHAISEAIRSEVALSNVRVITIAPGATESELISHTSNEEIKNGYKDWAKSIGGSIKATDVANSTYFAYSQPQNVCIREIVLAPTKQQP